MRPNLGDRLFKNSQSPLTGVFTESRQALEQAPHLYRFSFNPFLMFLEKGLWTNRSISNLAGSTAPQSFLPAYA